jgi:hypothetical protein
MNEFVIYSVYQNEDDIGGDERGFDLELNGKKVAEYGDYYHDKGSEQAKGFIDGYAYVKGWKKKVDYEIKYDNKIDENL